MSYFLICGFLFGTITLNKIQEMPLEFILSLFAFAHLVPEALIEFNTLHVEWTLTIELLWYILAPALMLVSRRNSLWCSGVLVCISFAWFYAANTGYLTPFYGGTEYMDSIHPGFQILFIERAFPAVIGFFLLGMIIYRYKEIIPSVPYLFVIPVIPLAFYDVFSLDNLGLNPLMPYALGQGGLLIFLLKVKEIKWKFIKWISDISYSIYLVHAVVMVQLLAHFQLTGWPAFGFGLIITLSLASLSYIAIERPAMQLARRLS